MHTFTHSHRAHFIATYIHGACVDAALCRYPWHVVFTGFRILIEAGGIFDGDYFSNNDDGQYAGYQ